MYPYHMSFGLFSNAISKRDRGNMEGSTNIVTICNIDVFRDGICHIRRIEQVNTKEIRRFNHKSNENRPNPRRLAFFGGKVLFFHLL